jgi:hypothetical protein
MDLHKKIDFSDICRMEKQMQRPNELEISLSFARLYCRDGKAESAPTGAAYILVLPESFWPVQFQWALSTTALPHYITAIPGGSLAGLAREHMLGSIP